MHCCPSSSIPYAIRCSKMVLNDLKSSKNAKLVQIQTCPNSSKLILSKTLDSNSPKFCQTIPCYRQHFPKDLWTILYKLWPLYSITDIVYNDVRTKDHGMASSNEGSGVLNDIFCIIVVVCSSLVLFLVFITFFPYYDQNIIILP